MSTTDPNTKLTRQALQDRIKGLSDEPPTIAQLDLSGQDYRAIDLSGGVFNEVDFSGCDFSESNLGQASFVKCNLDEIGRASCRERV